MCVYERLQLLTALCSRALGVCGTYTAYALMSLLVQRIQNCGQCFIPLLCLQFIHPSLKGTVQFAG